MKYIVYKTINLINGKEYIGVHYTDPDIYDGYIGCGVTKRDQKKKSKGFPKAVAKYGYENFKRETLFEYEDSEAGFLAAYQKEAELVTKEYVKSPNTYNLTIGGKFTVWNNLKKKISQYTLDGIFIRTWDSITEASRELKLTSINQCLLGTSKYCGGFQWKYYNESTDNIESIQTVEKTVYQFDLQGNLLKVWKSITLASQQFTNSQSMKVSISRVCLGQQSQANGYFWSFKNKFTYIPANKGYRAVAKYNDAGEFLESYTSITEAAIENNIKTRENIIAAISGRQKRCGGFRWRYFYGNTSNIKSL